MQIVCGALCVGGGLEDGPLVAFENFKPAFDVGGVVRARLQGNLQIAGQECAAQLGDQFFSGIAFITKTLAAQIAIQPRGVARPVGGLVRERRVVAFRIAKALEGRHLDVIGREAEEGAVSAVTDFSFGGGEEGFRMFDARDRIEHRLGELGVMGGQAVDLLDIEDRVALHVGDGLVDLLAGGFIGFGSGERVGVDDRLALLALADMRPEFGGLAVGHPGWRGKSAIDGSRPEHQDVDSVIGLTVMTQGPRDAPGGVLGIPGFHPGAHALFQIGDDLVGDARINVFAVCVFDRAHGLSPLLYGFLENTRNPGDGVIEAERAPPTGTVKGNGQHGSVREGSGPPVARTADPG